MKRFFAAVAAAIFLALPAHAETCSLIKVASYDMVFTKGGHIAIALQIGDTPRLMVLDTGGVMGMLHGDVVQAMNLPTTKGSTILNDLYGRTLNTIAMAPSITIGPVTAKDIPFAVIPPHIFDPDAAGVVAPDVLRLFDLDLDFANKRVNFFSVDHCPGRVVYWTTGTVGTIPFKLDSSGHIDVTVQLDGKDVDAIIDTGAPISTISAAAAQEIYGIAPAEEPGDGKPKQAVAHTFTSLALGAVSVANPTVAVMDDGTAAATSGYYISPLRWRPAIVGLRELSRLHVYIAYKEHVIYVTPADAH